MIYLFIAYIICTNVLAAFIYHKHLSKKILTLQREIIKLRLVVKKGDELWPAIESLKTQNQQQQSQIAALQLRR